jgi:prolyl oligopeptidase
MGHFKKTVVVLAIAGFFALSLIAEKAQLKYPLSRKTAQVDDYFGVKVADPYRWLEDIHSPETAAWVLEQKNLTEDYLKAIPFREKFRARLTEVSDYEKYSNAAKEGEYYTYRKNTGLQEQSVVYIQKGLDGEAKVLLDPNAHSVILTETAFSRDQKYFCYGISPGGSDWREFFVLETATGKKLADHVRWAKFSDLSWYKDGFFYSRYDEPNDADKLKAKVEFQKLFYHKLGTGQEEDELIFNDPNNPELGFGGEVTANEKYLVISGWVGTANYNFLYYKELETGSKVVPLVDKPMGQFVFVDESEGRFLVMTDFQAPNFKLICIDPLKPQPENWQTVIPEARDKLDDVVSVGGKLIASYLKDANSLLAVHDAGGKKLCDIGLPGIGTVSGISAKKENDEMFYTFSSFTYPPAIFRYQVKENRSYMFRRADVKFDPEKFVTNQVFYQSKDGTKVPMFIVHKKGIKLDGRNPTLLYGYGGFNSAEQPYFKGNLIPLLECGGVYALACLRGGSEYGEEWHRAAMFEKKQNVFDDFIAAAEYLIAKGYTSLQKLAIHGASNGGLLVAAVINQRPELFQVAFPEVGVLDMLRFQRFTIGWAWVGEYGSSEKPQQFNYLYAYSPLHNIREGLAYPATLVATADHDDRVFPAHSFKYIAALQNMYKGKNPMLLRVETEVGHGTGSTTSKTIEKYTDMYSFMFFNMRLTPEFK